MASHATTNFASHFSEMCKGRVGAWKPCLKEFSFVFIKFEPYPLNLSIYICSFISDTNFLKIL